MIKLWDNAPGYDKSYSGEEPHLLPFVLKSDKSSPCIIVCPGGAYRFHAEHEGEPVARWLNSIGISAFVLKYRCAPYRHRYITNDLLRAIRYVRYNAEEYGIDENRVGVLGFSAGGHLCSSAAVHFDDEVCDENDPIDKISSIPDFAVLCYPVISAEHCDTTEGTYVNLLADEFSKELLSYYSNEKYVKENTPPVFLWHTAADEGVPVTNSIAFAKALAEKKVPFELHIYPDGPHGMGLAEGKYAGEWTKSCEKWLESIL